MYNLYISVRLPSDARFAVWRPGRGLSVVCACVRSLCRLRDARLLYIRKQPHHQGVWAFKLSYVPRASRSFLYTLSRACARVFEKSEGDTGSHKVHPLCENQPRTGC